MSNEQKIVDNKEKYIGGRVITMESGLKFDANVVDLTLEKNFFTIITDEGYDVGYDLQFGGGTIRPNGLFDFSIMYNGSGTLIPKQMS